MLKRHILPIIAATIWISLSEFFRNELLFKHMWLDHYAGLGLEFPSATINNLTWGLWALVLAIGIRLLLTRFAPVQGALLSWVLCFVPMWLALGNLAVLPFVLLPFAIPLSLVEVLVAAAIIGMMTRETRG
jgi:hypothetical protein